MDKFLILSSFTELEVIGISQDEKSKKPQLLQRQHGRRLAIISLLIILISIFVVLLTISISLAGYYGIFLVLFILILSLPSEKPPKDLERTKRDIDRRTFFIGGPGGGGKGLIHFEDGGPTPYDPKSDEEKL